MKILRNTLAGLAGLLVLAVGAMVVAQAPGNLPVPSGFVAGNLVYAERTDKLSSYDANLTASLSPASVAADTCADQDFTLTGLKATDAVAVSPPALGSTKAVAVAARAEAADLVQMTFCNATGSADTPSSGTYRFAVIRAS